MTNIKVFTNDQVLSATVLPKVACNNQNSVRLSVTFDGAWDGYATSAVFYTSKDPTMYEVILTDGNCLVPAEVLTEEATLYIGVKGVKTASGEVKTSTLLRYKVLAGTPTMVISDPFPSVYSQLLEAYNVERARLDNLIANSGAVGGDEVVDARVGYDGTEYPTLFEAIAGQVGDLHTETHLLDKPCIYYAKINECDKALFNFDTDLKTIKLCEETLWLYINYNNKRHEVSSSELSIDSDWAGERAIYCYFNISTKQFVFRPAPYNDGSAVSLGYIIFDIPSASSCSVPFVIDGRYYNLMAHTMGREYASLTVGVCADAAIKVDFANRKLIFPDVPIIVSRNGYEQLAALYSGETEIDFVEGGSGTYHYLVGDKKEGLKFVSPSEFKLRSTQYYFGWVHDGAEAFHLNFRAEKAKTISILGDSISTYTGYVPEGNAVYYTGKNCGVTNVEQTWWKRVISRSGYILNTNNSWSGSRVTNTNGQESSGITRATLLDNGVDPDVIIVYLGINDFNHNVALGSFDGRGNTPTETTTFREAYAIMLRNILRRYTISKVYVCTLLPDQRNGADTGDPEYNENGVYLSKFNEAIKELAAAYCVEVIDLAACGITNYNASVYMGDYDGSSGCFLHPNANGHELMARKIYQAIKDY